MVAAADLDPDNASILVCGGGGVALKVTRKLKDMGSWVWMMQVRLWFRDRHRGVDDAGKTPVSFTLSEWAGNAATDNSNSCFD